MARLPEHLARVPVGRERISREELASHQRERILVAASGVFAKRGYQATTIDNIVAAAKASVGSFYSLFDGKEDCFLATFDGILARSRARIAAALAAADTWAEEAFLGLRELLELLVEDPLSARIVLIEAPTAGATATARYNALLDDTAEWLRRGRGEGSQAADLPPSFEQASIAGLAFFLQQRLLATTPLSVPELLAETAPLILEPVLGGEELRRLQGELAAV